ncbi:hypothetical protein TVAG_030180 [Trichomonas vaginalis G3]|uniref:Uncharacterized protein n=1 Tax=Trichomonas vaginalis (strain ATCC PRA-98 / G3) TaxID=412133 RepID=A2FVE5_TRIV3|nr:phosphatidylinositol-3,5-bisphosphate binding [Trichomonas vaginalis G3]EAX91119.1 hypothetical protein TVAG_030180 [Trichomonas vaginalis G3]KAI5519344.1 phosphatidylinositol-3,5-bisphosphate binding [Trichomonas vaginalis G3]|eukprot:XP_001304049.1 hypothetical protein [Trichomonas vaginalis G3]
MEEFAITTNRGFMIYEFATGTLLYEAMFPGGGALCISLLSDSNVIACCGDDSREGFSANTVVIWDRKDNKVIGLFQVENKILDLKFKLDYIIVAHGTKISFHDSFDFTEKLMCTNPIQDQLAFAIVPSSTIYYTALPAKNSKSIQIIDYHDPNYVLGIIPINVTKVNCVAFDRKGELVAIVTDEGKNIQLWDVYELKLVATYKRGMRSCNVTGIDFDSLSSFFIMTTLRGTLHAFAIPTPKERETIDPKSPMRSKFSFEIPKGINFHCRFDLAGYMITGISENGAFRKFRLDIEKNQIVSESELQLSL